MTNINFHLSGINRLRYNQKDEKLSLHLKETRPTQCTVDFTQVNFSLPVDVQHNIELLRVSVKEEDWDCARDKPVTKIVYFLKTGSGADQAQS